MIALRKKLKILLVEDEEGHVELIRRSFKTFNGEVGLTIARNIKEARDHLVQNIPDLVIADLRLPDGEGLEIVKANTETLYPVLIMTSHGNEQMAVEVMKAGALDYVVKSDAIFSEMPHIVKRSLREWDNIMERKRAQKELEAYRLHLEDLVKERTAKLKASQRELESWTQKIEAELDMARLIQSKLLPQEMPRIAGLVFHAVYLPMDKVGGDYYDFIQREGSLDMFIADVAGHGIPGAFLATIAKMAFQFYSREDISCEQFINLIDRTIHERSLGSHFVTAIHSRLDLTNMELTYCNAGHCSCIILNKHEVQVYKLTDRGLPLGVFYNFPPAKKVPYRENVVQLNQGDRVILYTDGVIECTNVRDQRFGEERMVSFIEEKKLNTPQEFCESLLKELRNYSGRETFSDDLTLLVMDYT